MNPEIAEIVNILSLLLRAYAGESEDSIGHGQHDTVLVGQDVVSALKWLERAKAAQSSGGFENVARAVGQMSVDIYETKEGIEFRYQDVVLAKLIVNQQAINRMQVSHG